VSLERLQKLISRAGVCSRREAEQYIRDGRVTVNGRTAALGDQADLASDSVKIDGKRLRPAERLRYILLYKPTAVVTTTDDPEGRPTVIDLLRGKVSEKVYPVGRLDYHSEGLVILTNDGEFALRVAHPRYGVLKEYLVKVRGTPNDAEVERLRRGTVIDGQRVMPREVTLVRPTPSGLNSWWRIVVGEGKTHEVRELFGRAGHAVQRLMRVAIGPLRDEKMKPGAWRELSDHEVDALLRGGRGEGKGSDAGTAGAGLHSQARRLHPGPAHRGRAAGAGPERHRQAGEQRKPARSVPQGVGRHRQGAAEPPSLPRRRRVLAAKGPRRTTRH
jgi:23S rRNA pseudouridine2605 synthase